MQLSVISSQLSDWLMGMPVLSLLVFGPLVAALVSMFLPGRVAKVFALLASVGVLGLAVQMYGDFNPGMAGYSFVEKMPWLPVWGITYHVGVDGISLPFILLTALLTPLCLLASWHVERKPGAFFGAFLALEGLVIGVFSALDFILFYVLWEAMLIPMFFIIGIWGGENRVYATLKFFLYTFLGSVLMLVAILFLFAKTGTFDVPTLTAALQQGGVITPLAAQLVWVAFFAAFAVKVPMWPVHTWLPDAHVQAPTAGSVILAGVLLKMGAYGFLRFSLPMVPEASAYFAPFVFTLSAIAVVYAALVAWVQTDIKKLIAYSSVSHMGLVTLALFAGTEAALHGGLLVMVNHGIVSAGLFLAVGVVYERLHTRELGKFGGLVQIMPQYAFVVMVLTLAAVALPGTNSFVGEFLALLGAWRVVPVYTGVATTGVIFGALYMLWLYRKMVFGVPSDFVKKHVSDLPDLTFREWVIFVPLLVLIPLLGIAPKYAMDLWRGPVENLSHVYGTKLIPPVVVEEVAPVVAAPAVSETVAVSGTVAVSAVSATGGH